MREQRQAHAVAQEHVLFSALGLTAEADAARAGYAMQPRETHAGPMRMRQRCFPAKMEHAVRHGHLVMRHGGLEAQAVAIPRQQLDAAGNQPCDGQMMMPPMAAWEDAAPREQAHAVAQERALFGALGLLPRRGYEQ